MKKPVRPIDQKLIVVSGRSLISGADMCLRRRLCSSVHAAITDCLVGENTRYETGSLLSRSVPRMRAEVCLHTGWCLRAECLLFCPNSRVVSSLSTVSSSWSGMPRSRSCASAMVTSCPAPRLMRPPDVLIELPLDRGKKPGAGCRDWRVGRSFEEATLLRQGDRWRRQDTRHWCPPRPAVVCMLFMLTTSSRSTGLWARGATEGVGVYDCCTLEAGWIIQSYVV